MSTIDWKDCYATGISQCDREHRELVNRINQLYEAIRSRKTRQQLPEIISALVEYTETHFRNEERLLTEHEFPGLKEHQQEHEALRKRIEEFRHDKGKDDATLARDLLNFLRAWLLHHIVEVDMLYGKLLQEKGLH